MIGVTGNYGFFSMLSVALCLTLVDDRVWEQVLPAQLLERARLGGRDRPPRVGWRLAPVALGTITLFTLGGLTFAREIATSIDRSGRPSVDLSWSDTVVGWVQSFRLVNGYGLFRVMTIERPEIVIQGSLDGIHWSVWACAGNRATCTTGPSWWRRINHASTGSSGSPRSTRRALATGSRLNYAATRRGPRGYRAGR